MVFHCSGAQPSTVLLVTTSAKACIASVHPTHSFAVPEPTFASFVGIWFATAGSDYASILLGDACRSAGALPARIATEKHAGSRHRRVRASLPSELDECRFARLRVRRRSAGFGPGSANETLKPLMLGTLKPVLRVGDLALSGPIARGDVGTVARPRQAALERDADCGELVGTLAHLAAGLAAGRRGG